MDVSVTIYTQNPAGTSLPYRGGVIPFGYLAEDGSVVSRTTYARLFQAIGTTYGAGDGSTTFKLPDSRGRVDVGSGAGSGLSARTLGATGGAETHQLTEAELASHTHIQNSHNHTQNSHSHNVYGSNNSTTTVKEIGAAAVTGIMGSADAGSGTRGYFSVTSGAAGAPQKYIQDVTPTNNPEVATNQSTGGNAAHNNMQPFLVCTKIIKF